MDVKGIFKNNEKWVARKLAIDPDYFKKMSDGQKPDFLYIGCSDSRVSIDKLMGIKPGEAFVHRNIANMVISIDLNCMSVLNYAINHLKVNHVVVCGHYGCGGIKAAMAQQDLGLLNPWLRNIRDVYRLHKKVLDGIEDPIERENRLVELNVQEQCINLIKTAEIQRASSSRDIKVHGWIFDMKTGKLKDLEIDFNKILSGIKEIYRLVEE